MSAISGLGIKKEFSVQQNRAIILSNYLALVCGLSSLFLLFIPENRNPGGVREVLLIIAVFVVPVLMNTWGLTRMSRMYLCWVPVISIMLLMISGMLQADRIEITSYDGLRIYLLALSVVPYLLFESEDGYLFILGVLPAFLALLFFDQILSAAGVGYATKGVHVANYHFMHTRIMIAYVIINGSCFSLKRVISHNDLFNQKLLAELNAKNRLIKLQSKTELKQVNDQLMANLEALSKRELTLKKSQQMAGLASWERDVATGETYWSDEMYDIFGLSDNYDLNDPDLMKVLFAEKSILIREAYQRLLSTHEPYDFTLEAKTPIGYVKWIRVFAFPILSNDQRVVSVNGIVHDVTRYKQSEELMKLNERRYRSLFEQASDGIMVTDLTGNFIDANESMCKMLGYTKDEFMRSNTSILVDVGEQNISSVAWNDLLDGKQVFLERDMTHRNGAVISIEANLKMFASDRLMAICRDISERKEIEREKEYARYLLRERIKELTTLYRSSQILAKDDIEIRDALQEIVMVLPEGWQYSSICAARIQYGDLTFTSPNFREALASQGAGFRINDREMGRVEIVYLEETPEEVEGPFLFEERNLINVIAEMLQSYLVRKGREEELKVSQANLRATINNTEILIWSVDRAFNLLTFNEPFERHVRENYSYDVFVGAPLFPRTVSEEGSALSRDWHTYFLRALSGEIVRAEGSRLGRYFNYSLSPIIENSNIIGVSIFADDITDQKEHEKALADAQVKISELRLAALRSVMNPHFVFNALNSIQYFIAKNDRLNAINYLSTFSKLIRGILTNSLNNTIRLSEEVELLKHYIDLEMIRFEGKFSFTIDVESGIDLENIEVPSLLIQPYVENAILHGLYNKSEPGKLTISVKEIGDAVLFEVEDNGIGREAAMKLRAKNFPNHKSMGVAVTEERLKLINSNRKISFEIEDLMDGNIPLGTRIKIWISI